MEYIIYSFISGALLGIFIGFNICYSKALKKSDLEKLKKSLGELTK